jgi:carlactone synthase/all-trans-10'-apo-beta-carotenal 13,14-cleaving dioxygenase
MIFVIRANSADYASFNNALSGKVQPHLLFSSELSEVESVPLTVEEGAVPQWLSGSLYRVGGGMYERGNRRVNNLVDGFSKVHNWHFTPGQAPTYTTKFLKSRIYNHTMSEDNMPPIPHIGEVIPPYSTWEKMEIIEFMAVSGMSDNNNVAVWELSDRGVCVTAESPTYIDVEHSTLDHITEYTVKPATLRSVDKETVSASHFARHPTTGDSYNYKFVLPLDSYWNWWAPSPAYHITRYYTNSDGVLTASVVGKVDVPLSDMRVVHTVGVTENYFVLPRFNLAFSTSSMTDMCANIKFDGEKSAVFDVVSLKTGELTRFVFAPAESQHIINSYERTNERGELEIVVDYPTKGDVSEYPDQCVFELLNTDNIKNEQYSYNEHWHCFQDIIIRRFILNMDTGEGSIQELPQMWSPKALQVEFPYINDAYRGLPYCYGYLHAWQYDVRNAMGLMKVNMCNESSIGWEEENKFPVEPIYVPRPGATTEDDGVIVSPVFDSVTNTSSVYIWNATDLTVLARLSNPVVVPFTLHGMWKEE